MSTNFPFPVFQVPSEETRAQPTRGARILSYVRQDHRLQDATPIRPTLSLAAKIVDFTDRFDLLAPVMVEEGTYMVREEGQ